MVMPTQSAPAVLEIYQLITMILLVSEEAPWYQKGACATY
jgi:hypothetical protein